MGVSVYLAEEYSDISPYTPQSVLVRSPYVWWEGDFAGIDWRAVIRDLFPGSFQTAGLDVDCSRDITSKEAGNGLRNVANVHMEAVCKDLSTDALFGVIGVDSVVTYSDMTTVSTRMHFKPLGGDLRAGDVKLDDLTVVPNYSLVARGGPERIRERLSDMWVSQIESVWK